MKWRINTFTPENKNTTRDAAVGNTALDEAALDNADSYVQSAHEAIQATSDTRS